MGPGKEKTGQGQLLSNLLMQISGDKTDLGKLGDALFDLSIFLMDGVGDINEINRLRDRWHNQTRGGTFFFGARDVDVKQFQNDMREIAELKEPLDSFLYFVPGGNGTIRVRLYIDEKGKPLATLVDYGTHETIREKFGRLS